MAPVIGFLCPMGETWFCPTQSSAGHWRENQQMGVCDLYVSFSCLSKKNFITMFLKVKNYILLVSSFLFHNCYIMIVKTSLMCY